jgi:hypothetical protein
MPHHQSSGLGSLFFSSRAMKKKLLSHFVNIFGGTFTVVNDHHSLVCSWKGLCDGKCFLRDNFHACSYNFAIFILIRGRQGKGWNVLLFIDRLNGIFTEE